MTNETIKRYFKRADILKNRIIIPKEFINRHGRELIMEMTNDTITIKPIKNVLK